MSANAIDELTRSIQKAVAEIKRLRRENTRLEEKAVKLEKGLEDAPRVQAEGAAWREEREAIRSRVTELVEHLEEALAD